MVKILFADKPRKELRKQLKRPSLDRNTYEDTNYLIGLLNKIAKSTDNIRVKLVRTFPFPSYRMTILRKYKESRNIKRKNGSLAVLKPGWYVEQSFFAIKYMDGFTFEPPLPEGIENVNGNPKAN